jgi:putative Ca2+/H+ antiporter (TMEM165/GDT1 family)
MNFQALILSFFMVALAELGDKTQLTVLTLSVRYKASSIFTGASSAYFLLTILAVSVGTVLYKIIPSFYITVISALLFVVFGVFILVKSADEELEAVKGQKGGFLTAFSLIFITEFGDKTQLITIALAAKYKAPVEVFTGALFGLSAISLLSVTAGKTILRFVKNVSLIHQLAGVVFVILGLFTFLSLFW